MSATLQHEPQSPSLEPMQRRLRARLSVVRRRLRMHLLVEGLFWVISSVLLAAAVSLALDWTLRLNLASRIGLGLAALGAILVVVYRKLIRPLMLPLADLDLAELLDRRSPGVGQRISNVLQLPELIDAGDHTSASMIHSAVSDCSESLERIDLTAPLNVARRHKLLALCLLWLLCAGAFGVAWPATASLWVRRWLAGSTIRWPQQTYLNIVGLGQDARLLVPRGEIALLQINARPAFVQHQDGWLLEGRGEPLLVEGADPPQSQPPEQVSLTYVSADGAKRRGNATQFDETNFRYELPPLGEPVRVDLVGGDDWLGPITIEPIDRPSVSTLELTARRPGSEAAERQQVGEASQQLLFLPETQLELRLVADQPLVSAEALDKGAPLPGFKRVDEKTYTLAWTMKESLALEFRLVSTLGELSSKPSYLAIGLLKDREPRVTVHPSGVGRRITPVARIPLELRVNDDFGVASLTLDWERSWLKDEKTQVETRHEPMELPPAPEGAPALPEVRLNYEMSLAGRGVAPGNTLKLRGTAVDNCALGAQAGNSRWVTFQVVSADELFYEILMRQREQRARFAGALENAKAQAKIIADLSQPADALAVSRAEQVIARQVWQVANQLDQTLQEMTLNDLGNPQARENLETAIIAPMRKLHVDLLSRLRAGLDSMGRQPTIAETPRTEAQALADQSVEVMQGILAQMSLWESFIDVINQLKQVIERQNQVLQSTQEIDKERTDKLFDD